MDKLIDDSKFLVSFPVWLLVHSQLLHKGHITLTGPNGEKAVPMFTDKDLAERFQKESPELEHYVLAVAKQKVELSKLLDGILAAGWSYVTFDHTKNGAAYYEIALLKTYL